MALTNEMPFIITKADIISSRGTGIFGINSNITDFVIFEHIDKPYLTGQLSFVDNGGFLEKINFTGTDILEINITDEGSNDKPINIVNRKFVIDKVLKIRTGTADAINVIDLHITELHGWLDKTINATGVYQGDRQQIIEFILKQWLAPSQGSSTDPGLALIKENGYTDALRHYIIPQNTTPLSACMRIRNLDSSITGYPFFLFSALNNVGLRYQSLENILSNNNNIISEPFFWDNATTNGLYGIKSFESHKTYNYAKLLRQGHFSSRNDHRDPTTGGSNYFDYIWSDVSTNYNVPDGADKTFPITNTHISPRTTFENLGMLSIDSVPEGRDHKEKLFANSLKGILSETSITIGIEEARLFLNESNSSSNPRTGQTQSTFSNSKTLGQKIGIKFNTSESGVIREDPIKSGNYFIYATRFIFKRNSGGAVSGSVLLTCTKVLNNTPTGTNFV